MTRSRRPASVEVPSKLVVRYSDGQVGVARLGLGGDGHDREA
jgi:hypothetical protein